MIEILVKYIQDHGYEIDVLPGVLLIRKVAKGQLFGMDWAIFKDDLCPDMEQYLHEEADCRMFQIEQAIAEYCGSTVV